MINIIKNIRIFCAINGRFILETIGMVTVIIFLIFKFLNSYTGINYNEKLDIKNEIDDLNVNNINSNKSLATYTTEGSLLKEAKKKKSGQEYSNKVEKTEIECITKFLDYCINKDEKNAYKMLSKECKEKYFKNIKSFKTKYIDKIFNIKRSYKINKEPNKYKITLSNNILETGTIKNRNIIEQYYTIQEDVLEDKLININL